MTREEILAQMDEAAREDRERFFQVADAMAFQPKYTGRLGELEAVKQQWRDMTALPDYPCIQWPMALPEWFPLVKFASCWGADHPDKELAEREMRAAVIPDMTKICGR